MNSKLVGKVAVVTGASKGIGASIAKHLAAEGATVVITYATSRSDAGKVVAEISDAGGRASAIQGDFSKPEDIASAFAEIKRRHGAINVLVNNAGVYRFQTIEEVTPEEFHRQFNLNVLGLLLTIQAALPLFGPEGGSIINIGSVVASMSPAHASIYSATKGAVDSITISLSKELGARKIRVNSINPGLIKTEGSIAQGVLETEFYDFMLRTTPLGRIGNPEDIGPTAAFLASDDSYWVNGVRLLASGGHTS